MKVIDLSHNITEEMPVYPGTEPPSLVAACTIGQDGFEEKRITMFSHTGTHIDAPAHILPGAKTINEFPVSHFCGKAVVLDFSSNRDGCIEVAELQPYRHHISNSEYIVLHTGWSKFWGSHEYFRNYPVLSVEGAKWISEFNLKGIGVDAISVDKVGSILFPVHKILLQKEILIIENLTNVEMLTEFGFTFYCFPLNITKSDGSPVRAVAVLT